MLYAYRYEADVDEKRFLNELLDRKIGFKFNTEWLCDGVIIDIDCDDVIQLWEIIRPLTDCHLLADTFAYLGNFTGYRKEAPEKKPSVIVSINMDQYRYIRNLEKQHQHFLKENWEVHKGWVRELKSSNTTVTISTLPFK